MLQRKSRLIEMWTYEKFSAWFYVGTLFGGYHTTGGRGASSNCWGNIREFFHSLVTILSENFRYNSLYCARIRKFSKGSRQTDHKRRFFQFMYVRKHIQSSAPPFFSLHTTTRSRCSALLSREIPATRINYRWNATCENETFCREVFHQQVSNTLTPLCVIIEATVSRVYRI